MSIQDKTHRPGQSGSEDQVHELVVGQAEKMGRRLGREREEKERRAYKGRSLFPSSMGFLGKRGGRWGRVPNPPQWIATSTQVCGIYPFAAGSARPTNGSPLGRDLLTGAAVATDHEALFKAGVISSPSMMVMGLNGLGKSTFCHTVALGQVNRGLIPGFFNPIKAGEHTVIIEMLGGQVFSFGPGQPGRFNMLSSGPLGKAARQIGGEVGRELMTLARGKNAQLVKVLMNISRARPLNDVEGMVLEALVDDVHDRSARPVSSDLLSAFLTPSARTLSSLGYSDAETFRADHRTLEQNVRALLSGDLGQMLSGEESLEFDVGNPGGFCFDTASIPTSDARLLSAAMLSSWSLGMDMIDAHWELAEHEQRLAVEAAASGEVYEPRVQWNGYTTLKDEFWFPLRAVEGIVDLQDKLSRTNRSTGTADMMATHSPKDMLSLAREEDREKAKGLIERSGLMALFALTQDDLESLSRVRELTAREIEQVKTFNTSPSWNGVTRVRRRGEKPSPPPGAGKVLLKVPGRVGIPVQTIETQIQASMHVTDSRYRNQSQGN